MIWRVPRSSSGADIDGGSIGSPRVTRFSAVHGRHEGAGPNNVTLRPGQSDDQVTWEIKRALGGAEAEIGCDKSRRKAERAATTRSAMRTAFSKIKTVLQSKPTQARNIDDSDLDDSVPLVVSSAGVEKGSAMGVCSRIARRLK